MMAVPVLLPVPGVTLGPSQPIPSTDNTTEVLSDVHE